MAFQQRHAAVQQKLDAGAAHELSLEMVREFMRRIRDIYAKASPRLKKDILKLVVHQVVHVPDKGFKVNLQIPADLGIQMASALSEISPATRHLAGGCLGVPMLYGGKACGGEGTCKCPKPLLWYPKLDNRLRKPLLLATTAAVSPPVAATGMPSSCP